MTLCTTKTIEFIRCKSHKVQANFNGGEITSDAGAILLNRADKMIGLTKRIASAINDPRCKSKIDHKAGDILRQRVYGLALGYEDLNDHATLRKDTAVQTAVGSDKDLASSSTLCRFENAADRQLCWDINKAFVEVFIESFKKPPKEIILDFDATDDPVHGDQIGKFFHGYYKHYCFLPLYVFCGKHLLAAYLRPSNMDPAYGAWSILKLLSKRFHSKQSFCYLQVFPYIKIRFNFCKVSNSIS
ncbi:MAG: IS1380 family transposase [Pseudomonadota bacterium]